MRRDQESSPVDSHVRTSASMAFANRSLSRIVHSQMIATRQLSSSSAEIFLASRARFDASLASQKPMFDFGRRSPRSHTGHPCQKQPWMNTTKRCRERTTSGRPGKSCWCSLYLSPRACRARRTAISGPESFDRTRAIRRLLTPFGAIATLAEIPPCVIIDLIASSAMARIGHFGETCSRPPEWTRTRRRSTLILRGHDTNCTISLVSQICL
jgi:hypothetical protein